MNEQKLEGQTAAETGLLLKQLVRRIRQQWGKQVEREVTFPQKMILAELSDNGPAKASSLACLLAISNGGITSLCDKLAAAGYISRKRIEDDRRVVYLEITASGIEVLEAARVLERELVQQLFTGFSGKDMAQLQRMFRAMLDNLQDTGGEVGR